MEQKNVLLSALSVGVGLGVGLGLSSGQKWVGGSGDYDEISEEQIVVELKNHVVDGKDSKVTFDHFPYYLSERTRALMSSAAYVHLKSQDFSKHTRNLSPASRAILLSGPTEIYQQSLAKALAHCFESKLLLLDITDFSLKIRRKYGCSRKEPSFRRSKSEVTLERMSGLFGSFSILPSTGETRAPLKHTNILCFDEKVFVQSLYKVIVSISKIGSIILYIRDVEKLILQSPRLYNLLQKMIKKLSGSVLILGSQIVDSQDDCKEIDERLNMLFPYNIEIKLPEDEAHLGSYKAQFDTFQLQFRDNRNHIAKVLEANDIDCDVPTSICHADTTILSNYIQEIVVSAISYHLMNTKDPEYRNGKLIISAKSLSYALNLFQSDNQAPENKNETEKSIPVTKKDAENPAPAKSEVPDNEFEKRIRAEVIPANEIGVTFADIGSLDDIKESLQELVMLPLRRPDLFKGGLLNPCRGILLFGPPGTGKTMLAKAIANEAGASFINVSMSTITSKLFGEVEKNVRALFTLAAKVAPTIIFVDEVDSMLGQRTIGEHECMRRIKNEFMTHWDGLLTRPGEQILVLAATNRPFDLDEAIIRRFERRIMVGLPSAENREMILKTLLAKEKHENLDFKELATMTEGFSGSDLKNLCITAAYRPVRELIEQERRKDMKKKKKEPQGQDSEDSSSKEEDKEDLEIMLRPLNMEDMRHAKSQVAASFASEGAVMGELKQWNDLYGEGGSRKKEQLTYFV
ncbi:putative microtubule-severing ATPase [Lupinus albus]|uniref:Putative microtubule-severing ATPase n=1 Tax=Lupinus albus TaxID=3870 RepID=A0A6A4QVG0_LUPAL|nr:putative microtubule-severing ATPase [Lupinus albus]